MIFLGIFLFVIFNLGNAFLLSKVMKRFNINLNSYILMAVGFFLLNAIIYVFYVFFYLVKSNSYFYLYVLIFIQVALIILYAFNWRYFIVSTEIDKKRFFMFLAMFVILIVWFSVLFLVINNHANENSEAWIIVNNIMNDRTLSQSFQILFDNSSGAYFKNFSVLSSSLITTGKLWQLSSNYECFEYIQWSTGIVYATIASCTFIGMFTRKFSNKSIWYITVGFILNFIIYMILFMFYESPSIGKAWLNLILMLSFYFIFFDRQIVIEENNTAIMMILCVGIAAISFDLIIISSVLILFFIFKSCLENKDPFGKIYYLFIPYIFIFITWIPINEPIIEITLLIILLVLAPFLFLTLKTEWFTRTRNALNHFFSNYIKQIAFLFIAIFWITCIFLLTSVWDFKMDLSLFNFDYLFNYYVFDKNNIKIVFSLVLWAIYGLIFLVVLIVKFLFKKHVFNNPAFSFIIFVILIALNPLVVALLNSINKIYHSANVTLINFFLLSFIPIELFYNDDKYFKKINLMKGMKHESSFN